MEIKEEFCARLESIKSEEESQGDIEPTALSEKYEASSQHPEVIWQTNDDISLSSRCRLCAILDNDMVDVFSSPKTEDILEKISYCLPIMVKEADTLPKQICRFCLEELERCYRFRKTVAEAQEQLLAFDKLVSMKSEKTDKNNDSFATYDAQSRSTERDNIDGPLKTISDAETNNNKSTIIPTDTQTANTVVEGNPSLSSLMSCPVEMRKSSSDTEHRNTEVFDSGRTTVVSEVIQQSTCDYLVHIKTPGIHEADCVREGQYKCKSCEKTFKSKAYLKQHEKMHSGKGLHSCEYCQKKFIRKSDRNRHVSVHTNERPFKCLLCEKSFKEQSSLKLHTAGHSEERNYNCSVCYKSFKTLKVKNRHMEVHTRNRPWQCHYCERTFLRKSNLKTHLINYCKKRY